MVMLLMTPQSQHILHLPSFLGTKKIGTTKDLDSFKANPSLTIPELVILSP